MVKKFRVKLKRSSIGCTKKQKDSLRCLGLGKRESEVLVLDHPAVRGQILKVHHLLDVQVENGK